MKAQPSTSDSQQQPVWMSGEGWGRLLGILDGLVEGVLPASPIEARTFAKVIREEVEERVGSAMASGRSDMTVKELEARLLSTENPMAQALDLLHGEGNWDEGEIEDLCNAFLGAIVQAHEDRRAGIEFPR